MSIAWTPDEYQLILDGCARITSHLEIDDVVKTTLEAMTELLPGARVAVAVLDGDKIRMLGAWPMASEEMLGLRVPVGEGIVGRAAAQKQPFYSPDIRNDERVWDRALHVPDFAEERSLLAVPLVARGDVVGVIEARSKEVDAFAERERALLLSLAPTAAAALKNAFAVREQRTAWDRRRLLEAQKAVFVWLVSAELRPSLEAARSHAAALRAAPAGTLREHATALVGTGRELARLVEEVLDLATNGPSEEETSESVDLVDALASIERGRPGPPIYVRGNRDRIERVLRQIIPAGEEAVPVEERHWVTLPLPWAPMDPDLLGALVTLAGGTLAGRTEIVFARPAP